MPTGPAISISEEGDGAVKFNARLLALERNLAEVPLAAAEVMSEMEAYTAKTWGSGVEVTESTLERWPEWSPLYNTGALKASLTRPDAEGAVREITPYGFRWGTSLFWAKLLYKGTRKMQPKPVVQSMKALRAVAGYYMRRYLLRNVVPVESDSGPTV